MRSRCKRITTSALLKTSVNLVLVAASLCLAPAALAQEDGAEAGAREGMSDRIKKYMGEDSGTARGGEPDPAIRQRFRERLMQMPPEKRDRLMQQMRERRGGFRGPESGPPGGPEGFGPPPDGPPDMGPGFEGGPPPGTMRRKMHDSQGFKGGKFFGKEPLDLTVLKLTDEQKNKIQSMRQVNGQKARRIYSELRSSRERFRDMLFDPGASNDQILAARKQVNKLQTQSEDLMLSDFLGIRKVLTKEQLELLPQVKPEHPQRRMAKPAKRFRAQPSES